MSPRAANYTERSPYRRIAISFIIAALAVTWLILYYTLARATVTLELKAANEVLETSLVVAPDESLADLTGTILVKEQTATKTYRAQGTGAKEAKASGTVTMINNNNSSQTLIATTRLLSPEKVLFRITKQVEVSAGGSVKVEAVADQAGSSGEIGPTKFTIPGLNATLQQKIYAESKEPMVRREKAGAKILASDLEEARHNLKEQITQPALADLREQLPEAERQLNVVYKTDILKATSSKPADTAASEFDYTITAKVIAIFYNPQTLREAALSKLNQATADTGKQVLSLDEQSLAVTVTNVASEANAAELAVKFLGHVTWTDLSKIITKQDLLGRTPAEVENYFSAWPGVTKAEVKLYPFWVTTVPTIADHIELNIK